MPSNNRYNDISEDKRWADIGLDSDEAKLVYTECRRYSNIRDSLDDLVQFAVIAIYTALTRKAEANIEIVNRRAFIRQVVRNTMLAKVVRKNKSDMIFHCVNLFDSIDTLEEKSVLDEDYTIDDDFGVTVDYLSRVRDTIDDTDEG